jgi:cyclic pyranopterin phosphate synthase
MGHPTDQFNRPLRDLRISVTDRCNFRCPYCMPADVFGPGHVFLHEPELMTLAELTRIVRAFRRLGVEKVRLTGGEPLLRPDVPDLIRALKQDLGVQDVALTTNGWMLEKLAPALRAAGLDRLNVSVDSLDDVTAGKLNGLGFKVGRVLRGIDAAAALGLPLKINCVIQRGLNDRASSSSWTSATRTIGPAIAWCRPASWSSASARSGRSTPWDRRIGARSPRATATGMAAARSG